MNTRSPFPDQLNWTSQDLANAVPLRLSELFAFDAALADVVAGDSANTPTVSRTQPGGYLPSPPSSTGFRIR